VSLYDRFGGHHERFLRGDGCGEGGRGFEKGDWFRGKVVGNAVIFQDFLKKIYF
jgi:hypothetical protein